EGDLGAVRKLTFPVTLSQPATSAVSLHYALTAGSATPGTDYVNASGNVNFTVSSSGFTGVLKNISIKTYPDVNIEPDETFTVTISGSLPAGTTMLRPTATGTITNDDS